MNDLEEIRSRHGPLVWNTVYRILRDYTESLDCYQDVFCEVLERTPDKTWKIGPPTCGGLLRAGPSTGFGRGNAGKAGSTRATLLLCKRPIRVPRRPRSSTNLWNWYASN